MPRAIDNVRLRNFFIEAPPCKDCGPLSVIHWQSYLNSFLAGLPQPNLSHSLSLVLEKIAVEIFRALRLISVEGEIDRSKVSLRTTVFADEAKKTGVRLFALRGPAGYNNIFYMNVGGKRHLIEGLPRVEWLNHGLAHRIDDKIFVKQKLIETGLPAVPGRSFSRFNARRVYRYSRFLEFPLVVKPRFGSMSQHVTVNIRNENELREAINKVLRYSHYFLVEKYLEKTDVYRATVIDENFVACVKRVPAHIIGDGVHSIRELVETKNQDPRRGVSKQKDVTIFKLVIDETSRKLLREKGYDLFSVPKAGEIVYLQEKVILDLGADLFEVTKTIHPDNLKLFRDVAALFGVKLVGIDFLAENIAKSWQEQNSAVIELNSLPYIDMHHFPTEGEPVRVAKYLCEMVMKYYG